MEFAIPEITRLNNLDESISYYFWRLPTGSHYLESFEDYILWRLIIIFGTVDDGKYKAADVSGIFPGLYSRSKASRSCCQFGTCTIVFHFVEYIIVIEFCINTIKYFTMYWPTDKKFWRSNLYSEILNRSSCFRQTVNEKFINF